MRNSLFILLFFPAILFAQKSHVGLIEFYGVEKLSSSNLKTVLGINEGAGMPANEVLEKKLLTIPGIYKANVSVVCCENDKSILFIGISEKDTNYFKLRPSPRQKILLPEKIQHAGIEFNKAIEEAVLKGESQDDLSRGHSWSKNLRVRMIQKQFILYASKYYAELKNVLYNASNAQARSIAAEVMGYSPYKRRVVKDLLFAVSDPDEGVRNNATRAIGAIAVLGNLKPELHIKISPTPFINMVNSIVWSDRNKGLMVLSYLTEKENIDLLRQLKLQAFSSLVEMARWKNNYAFTPFLLLCRIGKISNDQIYEAWSKGEKEMLISKVIEQSEENKQAK